MTVMAVHDLLARCARLCDQRDVDAWAALFTSDARFTVREVAYTGNAIRQWLVEQAENPAGCHVTVNVTVDSAGPDHAEAHADFIFVRREEGKGPWGVVSAGQYKDKIVRVDNRWLFAERRIILR